MKNRPRFLLLMLGVLGVAASAIPLLPVWLAPAPAARPAPGAALTGNLVVDLRDDASADDIRRIEERYRIDLTDNSPYSADDRLMRADLGDAAAARRLAARIRADADPRVEAAEPEVLFSVPKPPADAVAADGLRRDGRSDRRFVPNDPRYPEQWNLAMVGAEAAWERTRGKGAVVAVIDTGVAARDSARGKRCRDFGQTRFAPGYDFVHNDGDPFDDNGHGTHVAGTIAESTDNNEGAAGLAFEATILPLKVLSAEGSGTSADVADAIRYAADHGANVINLSLGSFFPSVVVHEAVRYAAKKGVVIVCAAGNGFGEPVAYPAAFPECIAVSSVGPSGEIAFYSSYGREVALAAPGGDMQGGARDGILQNTNFPEAQGGRGDDYYFFQGTSMAAPHVAAAAALVTAQGVRDPARVRDILARSATPKSPALKYGAGILSAEKATGRAAALGSRASLKWSLFAVLAGLVLVPMRRSPLVPRLGLIAALGVGFFGPDRSAALFGADSAWNLLGFSALVPFLLFWEWESGFGSRIVTALAFGVALCLGWNLLTDALPFTETAFGSRPLPWTVSNLAASLALAGAAWRRGR